MRGRDSIGQRGRNRRGGERREGGREEDGKTEKKRESEKDRKSLSWRDRKMDKEAKIEGKREERDRQ